MIKLLKTTDKEYLKATIGKGDSISEEQRNYFFSERTQARR